MNLPWLLLFLPLAIAVINQLALRRGPLAPWLSTASAISTLLIALRLLGQSGTFNIDWATIGDFHLQIGIKLDQLTTGMMTVVTGVGALVHIF
ncbi:MAG: NADH-quinone oxidoreductase subunit L, partial [Verrucomicrobia bacterium]|nr:NADH-quinone oxidoreductase subunit L [Verrucomicrobiota bacterium]